MSDLQIISMNTDGIFFRTDPDDLPRVRQVLKEFSDEIQCPIDLVEIGDHRQLNINNYLQLEKNGELKGKGSLNPYPGINADHNNLCVPRAIAEFMQHGTPVEDSIRQFAAQREFLLFTSIQTSRESTISVGGESVGKLIRVYHSKADDLPEIKIGAGAKVSEKRIARGCRYAPGVEWPDPDDLDVDWYIKECHSILEKTGTPFTPDNNKLAWSLEDKGFKLRGSGGQDTRTKRAGRANFSGSREISAFVGGSSGLAWIPGHELSEMPSLRLSHTTGEIHDLKVLKDAGWTMASLRKAYPDTQVKGWKVVHTIDGVESITYSQSVTPEDGESVTVEHVETVAAAQPPRATISNGELVSNEDYARLMFGDDWQEAYIVSQDHGDTERWYGGPIQYSPEKYLDATRGNYVCVSLVDPEDNEEGHAVYRRRRTNFREQRIFMFDDIGEKAIDPQTIGLPKATVIIQSSPGSEQHHYRLDPPVRNLAVMEQLLEAAKAGVDGEAVTDPGATDVCRLVRLPFGSNFKEKRIAELGAPYPTNVLHCDPTVSVTADQLAAAFGIELDWSIEDVRAEHSKAASRDDAQEHPVLTAFEDMGRLIGYAQDGWWDVDCPHKHNHSTGIPEGAPDGSKIKIADDGSWAYKCHHGSCAGDKEVDGEPIVINSKWVCDWLRDQNYSIPSPNGAGYSFFGYDVEEALAKVNRVDPHADELVLDMGFTEAGSKDDHGDESAIGKFMRAARAVDITKPPGLLGLICDDMDKVADRPIPQAYALYGLHLLGLANASRRGVNGVRMDLLTFLIAESGGGKGAPQNFLEKVLRAPSVNLQDKVLSNIPTDKDLARALIEKKSALFRIDEGQRLFQTVNNKNASSNQKNVSALILNTMTDEFVRFEGTWVRDFREQYEKQLVRIDRKLETEDMNQLHRDRLEREKAVVEERLYFLDNGMSGHYFALAATSTPKGLEGVVTDTAIESGLLGRSIVVRIDGVAEKRRGGARVTGRGDAYRNTKVINALASMIGRTRPIEMTEDAASLLDDIGMFYDDIDYREHEHFGPIYRRAEERILSVASLLGAQYDLVEIDHLLYATALFERHIHDCGLVMDLNKYKAGEAKTENESQLKVDTPPEVMLKRTKEAVVELMGDYPNKDWTKGRMQMQVSKRSKTKTFLPQQIEHKKKHPEFETAYDAALAHLEAEGVIEIDGVKVILVTN